MVNTLIIVALIGVAALYGARNPEKIKAAYVKFKAVRDRVFALVKSGLALLKKKEDEQQ